jgi:hypothetical protein
MTRLEAFLAAMVIVIGVGGFTIGFLLHPATTTMTRVVPSAATLSGVSFSCVPSGSSTEGVLRFNLTSTYRTDIIASVAYLGAWTGDTNQIVHPNVTKTVSVAQGSYPVGSCPYVAAEIWRVVELLANCPNPPCDTGTTSVQP